MVLLVALGGATLVASGCVKYRAHIEVTPDGKVEMTERAEAMPGTMDSLHVDPRLAWTAFEATVGQGKIYAFGPEVTFRAQPHGTFKFLFNGISLPPQAAAGRVGTQAARGGR